MAQAELDGNVREAVGEALVSEALAGKPAGPVELRVDRSLKQAVRLHADDWIVVVSAMEWCMEGFIGLRDTCECGARTVMESSQAEFALTVAKRGLMSLYNAIANSLDKAVLDKIRMERKKQPPRNDVGVAVDHWAVELIPGLLRLRAVVVMRDVEAFQAVKRLHDELKAQLK